MEQQLEPKTKTKNKNRFSVFLSVIAILFAACALMLSVFYMVRTQSEQKEAQETIIGLKSNVGVREGETAKLQEAFETLSQKQALLLEKTESLAKKLQNKQLDMPKNNVWQRKEIYYLLQLADFQRSYTKDPKQVADLLEIVKQRLSDMSDPRLANLSRILSDDLTKINNMPSVKTAELLEQLHVFKQKIEALKLVKTKSSIQTEKSDENKKKNWKKALDKSLSQIKSIISVRRVDQPIHFLLTPQQHAILQENMKLLLQRAEWSVLYKNKAAFKLSLTQVSDLIKHFYIDNPDSSQLVLKLGELAAVDIDPPIPNINGSLKEIRIQLEQ